MAGFKIQQQDSMLQIKQLTSKDCSITANKQKQIIGGGAGPHNGLKRYIPFKTTTELWSVYADGSYDINVFGIIIR